MNTEYGSSSSSLHLPLTLLALTTAIFLGTQIGAVKRGGKTINFQLGTTEKQIASTVEAQKQFVDAISKREELVKQSGKVQEQYTALLNDVIELAKTDEDAKKIVTKWGIQRQASPSGAATALPSGSASALPSGSAGSAPSADPKPAPAP
ncbi:MAG: hypothetical protein JWL59_4459 [Chthoniobacteraceae bacterium]|nr:hypothetical protein [Chthoniobacteraceae bacterium]